MKNGKVHFVQHVLPEESALSGNLGASKLGALGLMASPLAHLVS